MKLNLGVKLFISYLVVVLAGVAALSITASLVAPAALEHHIAEMQSVMEVPSLADDLRFNFRSALSEIFGFAAIAAILAATIVSMFVTRRIVNPVRQLMEVSRRIAEGDYHKRVMTNEQDELGQLAHTFNRMAARLEETEERRMELIGNVAHELRTPLSSIYALMEGLVDGVLPGEPATYIDVQREVTRLQRLIDDLQELSRAEAGQIRFTYQPTMISDLIKRATDQLRPQFHDKDVRLKVALTPNLPPVSVDPDRMTQVLLNLIGNALQYTPSGGEVTVRTHHDHHAIQIIVQDTGMGINPAHLPHIFDRFFRVDKSRSRSGGGSGVGLTIAKHLIEAHHGQIQVDSPGEGLGSTFIITLPLRN